MSNIISTPPTEEEKQIHAREGWDLRSVDRRVQTSGDPQIESHVGGIIVSLTYYNPDTGETKVAPHVMQGM